MQKSRLSFWQIWNMSFGFLGIQFGWGLQIANMSAIYTKLGANADEIPILWLAGPVTGLLVQPIVGSMSDRTWNRLGRRRPYFLFGAIFASIFQFIDPFQFDFSISIMVLCMVILGGIGNIWGVLVGGLVLGLFDRGISAQLSVWLRGIGSALGIPVLATIDLSTSRLLIFGAALVILMLVRPEGLFPSARRRAELHRDAAEASAHGELAYEAQMPRDG